MTWYKRWWVWAIAAVIIIGGITAAINGPADEPTPTTAPTSTPTPTPAPTEETTEEPDATVDVDWDQYPPNYQTIIDQDTEAQDCEALQNTFDTAPDDPQLLTYINNALTAAGCQ